MAGIRLFPIGRTECENGEFIVRLDPKYKDALIGLSGFSHALILWWFDGCDNENDRGAITEDKPYVDGPEILGVFATRSPSRPNPIAVSVCEIIEVNINEAIVRLAYLDAMNGTPVIDIKPYIPSADKVMNVKVPKWQEDWPKSYEESGDFDWEKIFNF